MNFKHYKLVQAFLAMDGDSYEPTLPVVSEDFLKDVLYYQDMFNSGPRSVMGHVADFSHISVHGEIQIDEMADEYPAQHFFWMFKSIGHFNPAKPEPVEGEEYLYQEADDKRWGDFEVLHIAPGWGDVGSIVVWAGTQESCRKWVYGEVPQ